MFIAEYEQWIVVLGPQGQICQNCSHWTYLIPMYRSIPTLIWSVFEPLWWIFRIDELSTAISRGVRCNDGSSCCMDCTVNSPDRKKVKNPIQQVSQSRTLSPMFRGLGTEFVLFEIRPMGWSAVCYCVTWVIASWVPIALVPIWGIPSVGLHSPEKRACVALLLDRSMLLNGKLSVIALLQIELKVVPM